LLRSPIREWSITNQGKVVAQIIHLNRDDGTPAKKGFMAGLKRFLKGSDWALLTPGSAHLFSAPVFVGQVMIYKEVIDAQIG